MRGWDEKQLGRRRGRWRSSLFYRRRRSWRTSFRRGRWNRRTSLCCRKCCRARDLELTLPALALRFFQLKLSLRAISVSAVFLIVVGGPGNQGPKLRRELLYSPVSFGFRLCRVGCLAPRLKVRRSRPDVPSGFYGQSFFSFIQRILSCRQGIASSNQRFLSFNQPVLSFIKHLLACVQFRFSFSGGSLLMAGGNHRERNEHRQGQNLFHK